MTHPDYARIGSLGGLVTAAQSQAKARALAVLHASRRGRRLHPDTRLRQTTLAELAAAVRDPLPGVRSIRVVAGFCRVSDRTVRRWLDGTDWPPASMVLRLRHWLKAEAGQNEAARRKWLAMSRTSLPGGQDF